MGSHAQTARDTHGDLDAELGRLAACDQDLAGLAAEVTGLQGELSRFRSEVEVLQRQLALRDATLAEREAALARLEEEHARVRREARETHTAFTEATTQLRAHDQMITSLTQDLAKLRADIDTRERNPTAGQHTPSQPPAEEALATLENARQELLAHASRVVTLEQELRALRLRLGRS